MEEGSRTEEVGMGRGRGGRGGLYGLELEFGIRIILRKLKCQPGSARDWICVGRLVHADEAETNQSSAIHTPSVHVCLAQSTYCIS